jgi:hypothetical protein
MCYRAHTNGRATYGNIWGMSSTLRNKLNKNFISDKRNIQIVLDIMDAAKTERIQRNMKTLFPFHRRAGLTLRGKRVKVTLPAVRIQDE